MSQDYNSLYQETAADPFAHRGFYETPPSSTSPQFPSVFSTMPNLQPYSTVPLAQDPEMVDLSKRALSDAGSTLPFWDNPASMEGPSARLSAGGSAFDSGEDWEIETDRPWYRKRWVAIVAVAGLLALAAIALGVGLGVGLGEKKQNNAEGGQQNQGELRKHPVDGFSAGLVDDDNIYEWEITIFGPADTLYDGGFFRARLTFPEDFPLNPPKMKFITEMWHPNIYKNGDVCISILHAPGVDQYGYEDAGERWMPVHGVESILISVISLLSADTPNTDSPANIDAAKEVREDIAAYRKKVRRLARKSAEEGW
ncbi:hypothetical protein MNV49_005895 [Pseudohyphozyma bogoriensis]|nr:hypothetical protein MNV49_005895 [Pseudohyphozyma bogoriensis]